MDTGNRAEENFVSDKDAVWFAERYKELGLAGGHVILLNPPESEYYEETRRQAFLALKAFRGGLQIGGGITAENAVSFLEAGASHVIVTSYVFKEGQIQYGNLERLRAEVGKSRLVIDVSCRKKEGEYYIVTDRWQNYTDRKLTAETLDLFADYCDEILVHAVDVEGKAEGIEENVVRILGTWGKLPATYAGGVHSFGDLRKLKELGGNQVDVTIGSALDIFGGTMRMEKVLEYMGDGTKEETGKQE